MHIIREEIPVTASPKFRRRLYLIVDPYLNFWFRYIYPNRVELEAHRYEEVLDEIKKDFPSYCGFMFERLIEQLIREKVLLSDFTFTRLGRQWGKIPKTKRTYEVDIVALNENAKEILFAECKWQNKVNAEKIVKELAEKAEYVEWHNKDRKEHFAVFSKSFGKKIDEFESKKVHCIDLRDIEQLLEDSG